GLDFTKTQSISPDLSYANGDLSGIINPKQADPVLKDITHKLRGGELEALFTARDQDMPAIQAELDEWVYNLTREFNAISSEGTTYPAATELVGTRSFDSLSDSLKATGTLRVTLVGRESSVIESFEDIDLSTLNTVDDLKTEIEKLG